MRNGFRSWWPLLIASLLAGGCRRSDLVEQELRARDVQYREALQELMRSEATVDNLRRENDVLRAGSGLSPELAAANFSVRKLVIGRGTAGVDNDRIPGDEVLTVWIEPRDADDHTMKAPGYLQIAVLEINSNGSKTLLSTWDIDPERLRCSWKQGLLSIGYEIVLPWQTPPRVENIRVAAKWTLPDGRCFEADKDIKVKLVPGALLRPEGPPPLLQSLPPLDGQIKLRPAILQTGNWTPVNGPAAAQTAAKTAAKTNGNWRPEPLQDAVGLGRPIPVEPPIRPGVSFARPPLGDVRIEE